MTDRREIEAFIVKARNDGHSVAPLYDRDGSLFAIKTNGRRQDPLTFAEWMRGNGDPAYRARG